MSEKFKQKLKELGNDWFDNFLYMGNDKLSIEDKIGMVIREEIQRRVDTFFDKPSPDILIEKVLSGQMSFDELYWEKYTNRLMENDNTKIKNYLKLVSGLLRKEQSSKDEWIIYVLLAKYLILLGAMANDDKTIKDKMFSLSRKL